MHDRNQRFKWRDARASYLCRLPLAMALVALLNPCLYAEDAALDYPHTRRSDQVDDYFGIEVADPYRWLEDGKSDETQAWIASQNKVTFEYLEAIPQRAALNDRLTELWNFERFGTPHQRGGKYFFTHNDGLQNQSVLYVSESLDGQPRVLIDPNQLSAQGTVALARWEVSDDGSKVAYALASDGSDWREWKVRDVETGKDLPDHLRWVKFSGVSWTPEGSGFYYSRYDKPETGTEFTGVNYYQKLYYHKLGDSQDDDQLIYQRADHKEWSFHGEVGENGHYLVMGVFRGTERKNQVFYRATGERSSEIVELITGFDAAYYFLGNDGPIFWFLTDWQAPRRRMIAIDIRKPQREFWREVIPESEDAIRFVELVGNQFVVSYLKDACSLVRTFHLSGQHIRDVQLPAIGTAVGFGGRRTDTDTFYAFSNFTTPSTIYRYDLDSGTSSVFRKPEVEFDPNDYETKQVFFQSTDGTEVPMFITYKKGIERNGENPTILSAYGGFNISITPRFRVSNLVWLERGGIYAVPNLRGGGEYGRQWHEAGMKENKQNVFDDFIAAAEWLIAHKYTNPRKLAIRGGSNGGLLVGAAMTQRPELFAAAVPTVGVMDMLRFHKFTIGWAWVSEYGSSDDAEQFHTLIKYSPLHRLKRGTKYPATLVMTADHDDRVVPAHSFKFAAQLQHCHAAAAPVLIRIETSAGHGAGTPTSKRIERSADALAFLTAVLNEQ